MAHARPRPRRRARHAVPLGAVALALVLAGCTGSSPAPSPSVVSPPTTPASPQVTVLASHLDSPWGLAALPGGRVLLTERDDARVVVVDLSSGATSEVGGPGAAELGRSTVHEGESGLLGVAVSPSFASDGRVFVYRTTAQGNEVVRARLTLGSSPSLGELTPIVSGIPSAQIHDGGRLAFGPDGYLYATTGDATGGTHAQDPGSLGGKILRVTQDGEAAPGNPSGTRVWTMGHRNVQGIGWDAAGRMFASEFGQDTWDELNQVLPGRNYGWPLVEGKESDRTGTDPSNPPPDYADPLVTWRTSDASPSGLAVSDEAIYLAGLRGETLWRVPLAPASSTAGSSTTAPATVGEPQALLRGAYGRLRAVLLDPTVRDTPGTDTLLVLTNNTDGRGTPASDDDRLLRVTVPSAG